jgi:integrase
MAKMREEMALADMGKPVIRDDRTLGEYLEYWLGFVSALRVRPSTQYRRADAVRRYIIAEIGDIRLSDLKPQHVLRLLVQLEAKGKSKYVRERAKQLLSSALKDAMKLEIIHRNVAVLVSTPKYKPKKRKIWDKEQVQEFLTFLKSVNHRYYPLFEILIHYGLRRGEVLGLRWQDINFDKNIICIRQALAEVGHTIVFTEPKTEMSVRDLPLLPNVKESLLNHRNAEPKYEDDLIFHSNRGKPVDPRSLLDTFKRLCRKAGLPAISLHEIRHTVATLLKESGVTPNDAQMILGHNDIRTTLQIYTQSTEASRVSAMSAFVTNLHGV